eukprot:6088130-Prymnesium_polylepis.1
MPPSGGHSLAAVARVSLVSSALRAPYCVSLPPSTARTHTEKVGDGRRSPEGRKHRRWEQTKGRCCAGCLDHEKGRCDWAVAGPRGRLAWARAWAR